MKMVKQIALLTGLVATGMVSAQSSDMIHMLKIGLEGDLATGKIAKASAGIRLSYQYLVTPGFGIGLASGYTHFFGRDNKLKDKLIEYTIKSNDVDIVPVSALVRLYPKKTEFYAGADLGYAFIVGNDKVVQGTEVGTVKVPSHLTSKKAPNGGLYLRPEIGWHNRDWNIDIHYNALLTGNKGDIVNDFTKKEIQNYSLGSVGIGVAYNIPIGK